MLDKLGYSAGSLQRANCTQCLRACAQEMNDYYFNLPMPDEHQRPEQIRQLLQKARRETALQVAPPIGPS